MSVDNMGERVAIIEQATKSNSRRIEKLEDNTEILMELKTLVKLQTENDQTQNVMLGKINENMTQLNSQSKDVEKRVGKIEVSIESNKIDPVSLLKQVLWVLIPAVVVGIVMYNLNLK